MKCECTLGGNDSDVENMMLCDSADLADYNGQPGV